MGKEKRGFNVQQKKILALGFEKIGFDLVDEYVVSLDKFQIKFIHINSLIPLDIADGIIIPSGIFESIERELSVAGPSRFEVKYLNDSILQRERELINLFKSNGWVCFLVQQIIDKVSYGLGEKKCNDTDLVKKFLNTLGIDRRAFKGSSIVEAKNDAFKNYIKSWGIAKTKLEIPDDNMDKKILATYADDVVGVEYYGKIFFLPFHSNRKNENEAISLTREITRAISDYIQKKRYEIPIWCSEFNFNKEEMLIKKLESLIGESKKTQQDLEIYKRYKGVLFQSGEILKGTVVNILKSFFYLNVDDTEDFKEDAIVMDDQNNVLAVVEIKGVKKGIKREYINQVDSHRERRELDTAIPGILLINDFMKVDGIENRLNETVDPDHIKHARNLNVLIVRAIDLIFIMRHLEDCGAPNEKFIQYASCGGGRLYYEGGEIKIDDGNK